MRRRIADVRPPMAICALLIALAGTASAAPKRAVRIETDPAGATVYLGDKESGAKGDTPLDLSLAPGEHTLILELDGYVPRFEVVTVAARGKGPQVFSFTLEPAVASITIEAEGFPPGARVIVDGEERGQPPLRLEVEPGAHHVEILADGQKPFDTWVEVAGGAEEKVVATMKPQPRPVQAAVQAPRPRGPRQPYATLGVGYDVAWRRFRYDEPRSPTAQPFDADGAGLLAVWAELHPHRGLGVLRPLWPLSIVGSFRYGLPLDTELPGNMSAQADWRAADVALRWHQGLGRWAAIVAEAGWMRTKIAFSADDGANIDAIPDVDYQALRIAARAVGRLGPVDVWVGAENQFVLDGGLVEDRFRGAEVDGYGLRAGVESRWWRGRITTRVEGAWVRYGWTFATQATDAYQAAGAHDDLFGITVAAGASF